MNNGGVLLLGGILATFGVSVVARSLWLGRVSDGVAKFDRDEQPVLYWFWISMYLIAIVLLIVGIAGLWAS